MISNSNWGKEFELYESRENEEKGRVNIARVWLHLKNNDTISAELSS